MNKMEFNGPYLYGYVEGERYNVENNPQQISAFILKNRFKNVRIVSVLDIPLITTIGGFIDYVADQTYLKEELLPVFVPIQRGEVEVPEFVPYQLNEEVSVIAQQKGIEMNGAKFDVVVTEIPYTHIIHLLELEGPKLVTDIINSTWQDELIKLLNLPKVDEDEDEIYYHIYCYCHKENGLILEYGWDGETGPMFTRVYEDEPVWPDFLEVINERNND
ncbi:hypothetical protein ACFSCX_06445 [Bacillus salitolerans]|uniref:Uncharacterized protein n=1 Tax=Bacillus salitolerans TaxID=1437434 RepID=A0ABW4LLY8_9BACI